MMNILICIMIGYLIGSLNPAALISKIKKTNLRNKGTGNLGATNTMIVLGKGFGTIVMAFDIAKAFCTVKLAQILFPALSLAGLIAGGATVAGHVWPFYLKFKGGKGLASFGGMILALDSGTFLILLTVACLAMVVFNYPVAMPFSAAVLFPILYVLRTGDVTAFALSTAISALIIVKHFGNFRKALNDEDVRIREYVKTRINR